MKLRDRLPPDDTTFGFDNNGDFLTLSPALLDKFFSLAEYVVDNVVTLDGTKHPQIDLAKAGLKVTKTDTNKQADQTVEFEVIRSGPYRIDAQFDVGNFAAIAASFEI